MDRYLNPHRNAGGSQILFVFTPPAYLKDHSIIQDALAYHRRVYLTQERARIGNSRSWVGIKPRWKNPGRMEQANLVAPYPLESNQWNLMAAQSLSGPGRVNL